MDRRDFFKTGARAAATSTLAGAAVSIPGQYVCAAETYLATDDDSAAPSKLWQLPERSLRILKRSV